MGIKVSKSEIKKLLDSIDLSQSALAAQEGWSPATIRRWKAGESNISVKRLKRLRELASGETTSNKVVGTSELSRFSTEQLRDEMLSRGWITRSKDQIE